MIWVRADFSLLKRDESILHSEPFDPSLRLHLWTGVTVSEATKELCHCDHASHRQLHLESPRLSWDTLAHVGEISGQISSFCSSLSFIHPEWSQGEYQSCCSRKSWSRYQHKPFHIKATTKRVKDQRKEVKKSQIYSIQVKCEVDFLQRPDTWTHFHKCVFNLTIKAGTKCVCSRGAGWVWGAVIHWLCVFLWLLRHEKIQSICQRDFTLSVCIWTELYLMSTTVSGNLYAATVY